MRDHAHALAALPHADHHHVAVVVEIKAQALRFLRQVALEARVLGIVGKRHGRVGHRVVADHLRQAGDQWFGIGGGRSGPFLRLQADGGGVNGHSGLQQQAAQGQQDGFLEHGEA
jgi:hypothetical protein